MWGTISYRDCLNGHFKTKKQRKQIQKQDMRPISMVCLKPVDKYSLTTQHYVTLHFWSFG